MEDVKLVLEFLDVFLLRITRLVVVADVGNVVELLVFNVLLERSFELHLEF